MFLIILLLPGALTDFCSQFTDCEKCAGRHRVTFETCHWCPTSNSCVSPISACAEGYRTIFDCPRLLEVPYNETFARRLAAPVIAAAQGSQDQMNQCLGRIEGKLQLWRRFTIQGNDGREHPDAFVAVDFTRRAIVVSFSSVAGGVKLLYNRFSAEFFTNRQAQFESSNGLVNRFIYDSWFKTWYVLGLENIIKDLLKAHPDFEIWIFGHAIGGAKADMTAVALTLKNITSAEKLKLLTFGATRVGDQSFVEMIETTVPERFRIINRHDMVTRFPKEFDGEWTPPHHHRYEVWYPSGMEENASFLVCLGAEDPQCSSRLLPWQLRADDNDVYFERSMTQWVLSGCEENDHVSKAINPKFKQPTLPSPIYDMNALKTAKPYTTTIGPSSLAPTQNTPRITLPPKHLLPVEKETEEKTAEISTLPKETTTTKRVSKHPWWYTTESSTTLTTVTLITKATRERNDANQADDDPTSTTVVPTTTSYFRSSFRNNSFRYFEKSEKFHGVPATSGTATMVEGQGPFNVQKTRPAKSHPWSYRLPKGTKGKSPERESWTKYQKYPKSRTTPSNEQFLTVVDREAGQTVSWNGKNDRPDIRQFNRFSMRRFKKSTVA